MKTVNVFWPAALLAATFVLVIASATTALAQDEDVRMVPAVAVATSYSPFARQVAMNVALPAGCMVMSTRGDRVVEYPDGTIVHHRALLEPAGVHCNTAAIAPCYDHCGDFARER